MDVVWKILDSMVVKVNTDSESPVLVELDVLEEPGQKLLIWRHCEKSFFHGQQKLKILLRLL